MGNVGLFDLRQYDLQGEVTIMNRYHSRNFRLTARIFGMLLGLVALLGFQASANGEGDQTKRVAVFQYADSPLHEQGVRGMIEGLKAKGFVTGENLELTLHNALRSTETAEKLAQEIGAARLDLILTSGTQALQAMVKANQDTKIDHVFGLVANPFRAGVGLNAQDFLDHPGHLVGVGSFPPVVPIFHLAKELYPDLKVVGVVWNPAETNSEEGTERAREISAELGIELLEANAGNFDEVGDAAKALVAKGAQALWIGADNTVHHAADAVIAAAREGGIPVMSSLPGDAQRGALIDLSHDWNQVGKTVGLMAGDILAGTDPSTIAVMVHPDRLRLILNEAALEGLTAPWSFPQEVVQRADEVVRIVD